MFQQGVGYTFTTDPKGTSLVIDPQIIPKPNVPFRLFEDSTPEGVAILRVSAGTFNNIIPTINGQQLGQPGAYFQKPSGNNIVYLSAQASQNTQAQFPEGTPTIVLAGGSSVPPSTATSAFVAIALITSATPAGTDVPVLTMHQLVNGSIWGERFECGNNPVLYWFAQV